MELGYARVSTTSQDLARQYDALHQHGLSDEHIWADKKTGADTDRPGLVALLGYAREGDVIVATTLDRLGRNLRDCLNLVHDLRERGIGIRTLTDPLPIDTADDSAMGQVAVAMLSLFSEIERVFANERAAHARAVRRANGHPVGRKRKLTPDQVDAARAAVSGGMSIRAAARAHGVGHATLHRALYATTPAQPNQPSATNQPPATVGPPEAASATSQPAPAPAPALAAASRTGKQPATTRQQTRTARHDDRAAAPAPRPEQAIDAAGAGVDAPGSGPGPASGPTDRELRAVRGREVLDVNATALTRNTDTGTYRVTAPTAAAGELVYVGWLERDPRRSSKWQARSAAGLTPGGAHRTRHEALLALLEPHYLPTHGGRARTRKQ